MTTEPTDVEKMHTVTSVAETFGVKPATIREWIKAEKIKGVKILGRWRVPHSEVVRIANKEYGNG